MKDSFSVVAKSEKVGLRIEVMVDSEENKTITAVKNVIFDMLRSQDFDADKITIKPKR